MNIQEQTDVVHQKVYDFLLYLYPLLSKYPKYEKFSLQTATRNAILEVLMELVKWEWYVKGKITKEQLQKSVRSWTGHASHANSYNLQKKIITLAARADEEAAAKAA